MGETDFKVILSPQALRDLEGIVSFIAADNPEAARRFGHRLLDEAKAIGQYPLAGRAIPEFSDPTIRERIFLSYRIVYQVREDQRSIVVSRFWHGARGTPDLSKTNELPPLQTVCPILTNDSLSEST
jgi:plasmid stabilization system protein ParE